MARSGKSPDRRLSILVAAAVLLAFGSSYAQQPARSGAAAADPLMQAMDKMNKGMAAAHATGNTDQDFVAMMIPHHRGAVDMAKAELASGKDPHLRRLARNIIASQDRQIGEMENWQAKHPAEPH
jgi:uncharacterized protein (DUF305 family)